MTHRKAQHAAQAEGEGQRRRATENILRPWLEGGAREQVAHGQHVAMKMHRALGLAGGAGGEGDQCHIVGGGLHIVEVRVVTGQQAVQRVW